MFARSRIIGHSEKYRKRADPSALSRERHAQGIKRKLKSVREPVGLTTTKETAKIRGRSKIVAGNFTIGCQGAYVSPELGFQKF
jgi:hypothetical protein